MQKTEIYPVAGKILLHLQCHISTDSISLAPDGAQVTAIDYSGQSIKTARGLAKEVGVDIDFIEADVLSLDTKLTKTFDLVYTSLGVLPWLNDLAK